TANPDCDQYSDSTVDAGNPVAWFNPPTISNYGCYLIIQPVEVPLPELSWSPFDLPASFGFPGWEICIDLYSFSAGFAGVDFVAILGTIVTMLAVGGIYMVLRNQ
ncbi:MAG: hypothetical protein H7836_15600, partial [Magnetococcus sp. YQC-3]